MGNHNRSYGEDEGADEMNLSKQIKRLREEAGFSQEELSEKIYVSRQTISNWENAKTYPDIISIIKLSDLYQISLDELLKGDDKMIEHLNESTNIVSSNKKLICVAIINIILFFGLVIFNTIISNNKYLLASVLVIAMCSIAALFYQVIKKF